MVEIVPTKKLLAKLKELTDVRDVNPVWRSCGCQEGWEGEAADLRRYLRGRLGRGTNVSMMESRG